MELTKKELLVLLDILNVVKDEGLGRGYSMSADWWLHFKHVRQKAIKEEKEKVG